MHSNYDYFATLDSYFLALKGNFRQES